MCDQELLIAYVYNELAPDDRMRFERHLAGCAACREEAGGFRGTRQLLAAWTPPGPDLGFRVVNDRPRGAWRAWWTPALGFAAAAVLVLAAAAAIANLRVSVDGSGVRVQTGWRTPVAAVAAAPAPAAVAAAAERRAEYDAIDRRLRELETRAPATRATPASAASAPAGPSDDELLRRFRTLLTQSESRQQQELALRVAQVVRDFDMQRQSDLVRIQQGLGRVESLTNAEAASHRQVMDILYRVTQQK